MRSCHFRRNLFCTIATVLVAGSLAWSDTQYYVPYDASKPNTSFNTIAAAVARAIQVGGYQWHYIYITQDIGSQPAVSVTDWRITIASNNTTNKNVYFNNTTGINMNPGCHLEYLNIYSIAGGKSFTIYSGGVGAINCNFYCINHPSDGSTNCNIMDGTSSNIRNCTFNDEQGGILTYNSPVMYVNSSSFNNWQYGISTNGTSTYSVPSGSNQMFTNNTFNTGTTTLPYWNVGLMATWNTYSIMPIDISNNRVRVKTKTGYGAIGLSLNGSGGYATVSNNRFCVTGQNNISGTMPRSETGNTNDCGF